MGFIGICINKDVISDRCNETRNVAHANLIRNPTLGSIFNLTLYFSFVYCPAAFRLPRDIIKS